MRLFRRRLKDSAFGRIDPNAENRRVRGGYHAYDNSIQGIIFAGYSSAPSLNTPAPSR